MSLGTIKIFDETSFVNGSLPEFDFGNCKYPIVIRGNVSLEKLYGYEIESLELHYFDLKPDTLRFLNIKHLRLDCCTGDVNYCVNTSLKIFNSNLNFVHVKGHVSIYDSTINDLYIVTCAQDKDKEIYLNDSVIKNINIDFKKLNSIISYSVDTDNVVLNGKSVNNLSIHPLSNFDFKSNIKKIKNCTIKTFDNSNINLESISKNKIKQYYFNFPEGNFLKYARSFEYFLKFDYYTCLLNYCVDNCIDLTKIEWPENFFDNKTEKIKSLLKSYIGVQKFEL